MTLKDYGITYFGIHELVPEQVIDHFGESRIIHFLDIRVFQAWNWIRSQRGNPIYMNTYALINRPDWYPSFQGRGLRVPSKAGLNTSQHFYGRAGDGDEVGIDNKELYNFCLDNQEKLIEFGVTTIESIEHTPTWVHLDTRYRGPNIGSLEIVNP